MTYSLIWLPEVLRTAGLNVIEVDGWQTRGHGDMGKVFGLMLHHTAECRDADTEPALKVITEGRLAGPNINPLKGPLANLGLGQAGDYYMIAAGRAYHAGPGEFRGCTEGNTHFIGTEAENDGIGEAWPAVQMDAFWRGSAAIAKYCGFSVDWIIGHKEWAPKRKVDPNFDMGEFRRKVSVLL